MSSRRVRVIIIAGVVLDVVVIALALGLHVQAQAQARSDRKARQSDQFEVRLYTIQRAVIAWSEGGRRDCPPASQVTQQGLSAFLGPGTEWPVNPYTGGPMHQGTGPGDYKYQPRGAQTESGFSAYSLTVTTPDGAFVGYEMTGGDAAMCHRPPPGAVVIDGQITGIVEESPPEVAGLTMLGTVYSPGAAQSKIVHLQLTSRTRIYDASGVALPRTAETGPVGENGSYWWRAVARHTDHGWVLLTLQALQ